MPYNHPYQIIGFHSCDKEVGLKIINGKKELIPSDNPWDWLGPGVYFWEENPIRGLSYAQESSEGKQFNKVQIQILFVVGAIIELGNCLNLVESESIKIVQEAYKGLTILSEEAGEKVPKNKGANKILDCAVFKYIHQSNRVQKKIPYDTIRCAFQEGGEVYPGSTINERLHIQVCVVNPLAIKGYFLPKPIRKYNPHF